MSFVKMTRILKSRIDLIFFLTLLIVLTGVYVWLEIDDPAKIWEKKPVKIQCKDPNISHPMASDQLIFWKNLLIALGIIFSFVLQIASIFSDRIESRINVIRERAIIIPLVRWITCFLIGLLGLLIITQSGLAEVLISNHYYVARNFLAVCQPHQLDLLCGNPDSQNWIGAICTTPVEIWMPAVKSMLPKMMIFYYYLMLTSLIRMFIKWHWKEMLYSGLILQAIGIAFIVGVGVVSVFYCNEGHPSGVMVGGLLILWMSFSWVVIDAVLAFLNDDNFPDEEEELPLYWNDVLQENIIPQFGQLPITTVLPACGYQYPKLMETGLKPQKDNYTDTPRSPSLYNKWEDIALGNPPDLITLY